MILTSARNAGDLAGETSGQTVPPGDVPSRAGTTRGERNAALDAARFLAAIAIIWQHTPESDALKRFSFLSTFAVPFFAATSVLMAIESVRRNPRRGFGTYSSSRFTRLYVPFLIWSAVYWGLRNLKHLVLTGQPAVALDWGILAGDVMAGSTHHLWFLPFIFALSCLVFLLTKLICGRPVAQWVTFVVSIAGGSWVAIYGKPYFPEYYILNRTWAAMPAVLWAIALGAISPSIAPTVWRHPAIRAAALLLMIVCLPLAVMQWQNLAMENLAGMGFLILAMGTTPSPLIEKLAAMSGLAYTIYLCHIMFVEGIQAGAARAGFSGRWWLDLLVFVSTTAGAIALANLISRIGKRLRIKRHSSASSA